MEFVQELNSRKNKNNQKMFDLPLFPEASL